MNRLRWYLFVMWFPLFLASLSFFTILLLLVDLFARMNEYLERAVSIQDLLNIYFLYLPQTFSIVLPLALLFSLSFLLGNLRGQREIFAIWNSGLSISRLLLPFFALSAIFSVGLFFFDDHITVPFMRQKVQKENLILGTSSQSGAIVVLQSLEGRLLYQASSYDSVSKELRNPLVVLRSEGGSLEGLMILRARRAQFEFDKDSQENGLWNFYDVIHYEWKNGRFWTSHHSVYQNPFFKERPALFESGGNFLSSLRLRQLQDWKNYLIENNFSQQNVSTEIYARFFAPLRIFVGVILALSLGFFFHKHILLMSLFLSLLVAVLYYVLNLSFTILSTMGFLPPFLGASLSSLVILSTGIILLRGR